MYDSESDEVGPFFFGHAGSFGAESAENGLVFLVQSFESAVVFAKEGRLVEPLSLQAKVKGFIGLIVITEDVSNTRTYFERLSNDLFKQCLINLGEGKLLKSFDLDNNQTTLSEVLLTMSSLLLGF